MATLAGYQAPAGLAESTGRVAFDAWHVVRHPALRYWATSIAHAERIVRTAGPLAWLMCFFNGTFTTVTAAVVLVGLGADPGLGGMILSNLGLREVTLIVASTAIAASMGSAFVTELGSMRIGDEIDAIESLGLHSYPYLVSTRVLGAILASIPIYAGAIAATFLGGWFSAFFQTSNVNPGNFGMWFNLGIAPLDVLWAMIKGIIATGIVAIVCASTGYRASGGPVGVGMAVGEAMNLSMVLVMIVNLLLSYLFWGVADVTGQL